VIGRSDELKGEAVTAFFTMKERAAPMVNCKLKIQMFILKYSLNLI